MAQLVDDLRTAVTAALETEEHRQRHQQIDQSSTSVVKRR
jgi:hypothetical protein